MKFSEVYETKIYDKSFEELYEYLFKKNIENIWDLSTHNPSNDYEREYEAINISIMDRRLPCEIRIRKYLYKYTITIDITKEYDKQNEISYEKLEFYSSTNLHSLINQLNKILIKYIGEAND